MHGGGWGGSSASHQLHSASCTLLRGSFSSSLPYPIIIPTHCRLGRGIWAASSLACHPLRGLPLDYVPAHRPRQAHVRSSPSVIHLLHSPHAFAKAPHARQLSLKSSRLEGREFPPIPTGGAPIALCMVCRGCGGCPQTAATFLQLFELVVLTCGVFGCALRGFP